MKITDIKTYVIRMPFIKRDVPLSIMPFRLVGIVKVMTDEGITGVGECRGDAAVATYIEKTLKPWFLGKSPLAVVKLWNEVGKFGQPGIAARHGLGASALSGVETALWDITGKALNVPVYQLLGGLAHERIRAYASLPRYAKPEEAGEVAEACVKKGYSAIKVHWTGLEAVAAVRKAVGDDVDMMVDVNGLWETVDAIRMGRKLEAYNVYWFEEPIFPLDDYDGLAQVKAALRIPLAAGENERSARSFLGLIEKRAVDYLQPSVAGVGGIWQEKTVFMMGEAMGFKVAPLGWAFGPGQAATHHVSFSCPNAMIIETVIEIPEASMYTKTEAAPVNGYWMPPQGPGLGIELDDRVLAKYAV